MVCNDGQNSNETSTYTVSNKIFRKCRELVCHINLSGPFFWDTVLNDGPQTIIKLLLTGTLFALLLADLNGQICDVCHWSVRHVRGHILKTKQDRSIVTMGTLYREKKWEHYIEVGTTDSVATFRSSRRSPNGEIICFLINSMFQILVWPIVRLWHQTTAVVNRLRLS